MFIHSAVVSTEHRRLLPDMGGPFLCSYYYLKSNQHLREAALYYARRYPFMVDSGTFSFMAKYWAGVKSGKTSPKEVLQKVEPFLERYVAWLRQHSGTIRVAVEADMHELFGYEKVKEWREELFMPLQKETGIHIVYVWRHIGSYETARDILDDDRITYAAFGGGHAERNHAERARLDKRRRAYALACHERGLPVHGFGLSVERALTAAPFATSDSTTWSAVDRYGGNVGYDARRGGTVFSKASIAKRKDFSKELLVKKAREAGIPLTHYTKDKDEWRRLAMLLGVRSKLHLQAKITRLWRRRGIDWEGPLRKVYGESYVPEEWIGVTE